MPDNQVPLSFQIAAIPAGNYTPQQLAAAIAERLTASSGETFAVFVTSTTEPASNVGKWFDPVNLVWKSWDDDVGGYVEDQYSAEKVKPGNLGTLGPVNVSVRGKLFHPDYPAVLFNSTEIGLQATDPYVTGTGTAFDFDLPLPVRMVGPGHADAAGGVYPIICPGPDGYARIQFNARFINDAPDVESLCVFLELNDSGVFVAIQAIDSDDAGNQIAFGFRRLLIAVGDSVKFYAAPCTGAGAIPVSVTGRLELDVMALNG